MSQISCPEIKIPGSLSAELRRKLALLHEAPPGIAESTIALLGFGTRSALLTSNPPVIAMSQDGLITITSEGKRIIEKCAAEIEDQGKDRTGDESFSWNSEHQARLERALASLEDNPSPRERALAEQSSGH